jgi:putative thioredoxin
MIDITLDNFQTELVQASLQQPVLLDIWAPWCGPCKQLGPVLEKLEVAYAGRFVLAKLNSDEVPDLAGQLSQMFGVRSIPFCVMFAGGQPVDGFVGALPEAQIREFLDKHVPSAEEMEAEAEIEEAETLAETGDENTAIAKLQEALELAPQNDTARFDLIKLLIDQNRLAEARAVFDPVARQPLLDARLGAIGWHLLACEKAAKARPMADLDAAIAADKRDFGARFERALVLFAQKQPTAAMDELLEIIMRDKAWGDQNPRKVYVAILELLTKPAPKAAATEAKSTLELTGKAVIPPSDPVIDTYRRRLSMALF